MKLSDDQISARFGGKKPSFDFSISTNHPFESLKYQLEIRKKKIITFIPNHEIRSCTECMRGSFLNAPRPLCVSLEEFRSLQKLHGVLGYWNN